MPGARINVHIGRIVVAPGAGWHRRPARADVASNIRDALQARLAEGGGLRGAADRNTIADAVGEGLAPGGPADRKVSKL